MHTDILPFSPETLGAICSLGTSCARRLYPYLISLESVIFHEVIHGRHINCAITQMQKQLGWNVFLHTIFKQWKGMFVSYFLGLICFMFLQYTLRCPIYWFHILQKKKNCQIHFEVAFTTLYSEIIIFCFRRASSIKDEAVFLQC